MTQSDTVVRLERRFAAPPDAVFDAWTHPEVLRRWWAAHPDWTSPGCDVDLRVGGRFVLRMEDTASGEVHVAAGEYREIDRPHRLVHTWQWLDADGTPASDASLVTIAFRPDGDGTVVVLEHAGLPTEASRRRHEEGWLAALGSLGARIFPGPGETTRRAEG